MQLACDVRVVKVLPCPSPLDIREWRDRPIRRFIRRVQLSREANPVRHFAWWKGGDYLGSGVGHHQGRGSGEVAMCRMEICWVSGLGTWYSEGNSVKLRRRYLLSNGQLRFKKVICMSLQGTDPQDERTRKAIQQEFEEGISTQIDDGELSELNERMSQLAKREKQWEEIKMMLANLEMLTGLQLLKRPSGEPAVSAWIFIALSLFIPFVLLWELGQSLNAFTYHPPPSPSPPW